MRAFAHFHSWGFHGWGHYGRGCGFGGAFMLLLILLAVLIALSLSQRGSK